MAMTDNLFDLTARAFAASTDALIARDRYVRGRLFVEAVGRHVPRGGRILDYGCGPGRIASLIAGEGYSVLGIDTSEAMIAEANAHGGRARDVVFEPAGPDLRQLGVAEFDGIVCSSVIEYVADASGLLSRFHGTLRPGGSLILSYANKYSVWRAYEYLRSRGKAPHLARQHHVWGFRDCRAALVRAGFEVVDGPAFFDSPFDWLPVLSILGPRRFVGMLGLVVARALPGPV